ncbi:MAG TPA: hypothetical protein DD670_10695 [Planctomycetaceae bacterium]|nr:hypothetical protein [Planctomycetaceae bacterium]
MATKRSATVRRRSQAEIKEALKQLRDYYSLGCKLLKSGLPQAERSNYGQGVVLARAEELRLPPFRLYRAKQFASEYSHEKFTELLKLRLPDGMPLSRMHVDGLLKVKNPRERNKLLKRVIKEGWSANRLARYVKQGDREGVKDGVFHCVGRLPKRPQSRYEGLRQMESMSIRWMRWYKNLPPTRPDTDESSPVSLTSFSPSVRTKLDAAVAAIEELHGTVRRALAMK